VHLCQGLLGALATGSIMASIASLALFGTGVSMPCCGMNPAALGDGP
jgi:hypothetical protein